MTTNRTDLSGHDGDFDCIDPVLGSELWQLADPDCPDELRSRLETHVAFCADCRMSLAVDHFAVAGLQDGSLALDRGSSRFGLLSFWTVGLGSAALAAGLALMVIMPPSAPREELTLRGEGSPVVERPVADEVVLGSRPTLRWTPLDGATRYQVQVDAVDDSYHWSTSTDIPSATVPPDHNLPADTRFRVRVEPVPAHLAPDGALSSSFSTGSPGDWFAHRLRFGSDAGRALGGVGMMGLIAGLFGLIRWRRSA